MEPKGKRTPMTIEDFFRIREIILHSDNPRKKLNKRNSQAAVLDLGSPGDELDQNPLAVDVDYGMKEPTPHRKVGIARLPVNRGHRIEQAPPAE